jgi:7-cyano-7-deazaguanine synthase in queuosine biosynthesis
MSDRPPDVERVPGHHVLLYSGGLDSHIHYRLLHSPILLRFNTRHRYDLAERRAIERLRALGAFRNAELRTSDALDFSDLELDNAEVPFRNVLFALIGAAVANDVVLAAGTGDEGHDKDHVYAQLTSALATYVNQWDRMPRAFEPIRVHTPAKALTKAELVRLYLWNQHSVEELAATISCHRGDVCGECDPCVRRWVALAHNNLTHITDWRKPPQWSDKAEAMLAEARARERPNREQLEMIEALETAARRRAARYP